MPKVRHLPARGRGHRDLWSATRQRTRNDCAVGSPSRALGLMLKRAAFRKQASRNGAGGQHMSAPADERPDGLALIGGAGKQGLAEN